MKTDLLKSIVELKREIKEIEKTLEPLKDKENELKKELLDEMRKDNLQSIKYDNSSITKTTKKSIVIIDHKELCNDLRERKLEKNIIETVNPQFWPVLSKEALANDIIFKGTEISESEYISIRDNKKDDKISISIN